MKPTATLTQTLELAPSELFVADIKKMTAYYHGIVGLPLLETSAKSVTLGHDQTSVITLSSQPNLAYASPRNAGLFHNAVVFQSRGDLAQAAGNTIMKMPETFSGTGDHLVSEAFYFTDPEGNGLELYFDRPRDTWQWQEGHIKMDTLYIDPIAYVYKNASESTGSHIKLGHVHLKVGNIPEAQKFYVGLLGFDITALVPGALFISIGGYHHHLALNTWLSEGAGIRQPSLGFSEVTISLETNDDINRLATRLQAANHKFSLTNSRLTVSDPWGNILIFKAS